MLGDVRLDPDRGVVVADRLAVPLLPRPQVAPCVVGRGGARVELEGSVEIGEGPIMIHARGMGAAAGDVDHGVIRTEPDRDVESAARLDPAFRRLVDLAVGLELVSPSASKGEDHSPEGVVRLICPDESGESKNSGESELDGASRHG